MRILWLLGLAAAVVPAQAAVLWDQAARDWSATPGADQEFGDQPGDSTYQVADVTVPAGGWQIDSVTTYFTRSSGFWFGLNQARLNIFSKTGALPTGGDDPQAGTLVPVKLSTVDDGQGWAVRATGLGGLLVPGDYWIGLTPIGDFADFGQEFHAVTSGGVQGEQTAVRNPGGGLGFGTAWAGLSILGSAAADMAILIEGEIVPEPASAGLLLLAALVLRFRR